ncbi:MAG: D-alanyl-D-alanine carboxypeptidase family protein [Acidimicrobiales bacterium]
MSPANHARHRLPRSPGASRMATSPSMRLLLLLVVVLLAIAYVVVQFVRPVPPVTASATPISTTMPGAPASLSWPSQGEAAIGVEGTGLLATHGAQTPTPLASVTKLMTAYVVLHDHPLTITAPGPNITITPADVATYQRDKAGGDSVVAVQSGEQLSERQALEALLIPSGDNIAALLADWDAGSETAFVAKMNAAAQQLGLTHTHYADASGVLSGTQSTAASQVRLAMVDMSMPAFRAIVDMAQVTLPIVGLQYNVDALLGKDGIVGVKTGYTTTAGGCFVFAQHTTIGGRPETLVGAIFRQFGTTAQPSAITEVFDATTALIASADRALERTTVVRHGQGLGHLDAPWAGSVDLEAARGVTLTGLAGQRVTATVVLPDKVNAPIPAGRDFGTAKVKVGNEQVTVPLVTSSALPSAPMSWRLTNL